MIPIESNRIIADSPFASNNTKINIEHYIDSGNDNGLKEFYENLQYHSDWNMTMPVVEKIRKFGSRELGVYGSFSVTIHTDNYFTTRGGCLISGNIDLWEIDRYTRKEVPQIHCHSDNSAIEAVYTAVIQFINWYNTQTQKHTTP